MLRTSGVARIPKGDAKFVSLKTLAILNILAKILANAPRHAPNYASAGHILPVERHLSNDTWGLVSPDSLKLKNLILDENWL